MTYTPTQLEVIQVFGKKELWKWLLFNYKLWNFEMLDSNNSIHIPNLVYHHNYQLFPNVIPVVGDNNFEILWHIPHLENLFQLAEEKGFAYIALEPAQIRLTKYFWKDRPEWVHVIPYNPTLPLIYQEESVLIELLTIFK